MSSNVLVVDDDLGILKSLYRVLRSEPYTLCLAQSSEEALRILRASPFKVAICDQRMAGLQGVEFLALARQLYPRMQRIMLTGQATLETAVQAVNEGEVFRLLTKPWDDQVLKSVVRSAIVRFDEDAAARLREPFQLQRERAQVQLEKEYPGICRVERDACGRLKIEPCSEEEEARISSRLLGGEGREGDGR